jgi:hypothetical protein
MCGYGRRVGHILPKKSIKETTPINTASKSVLAAGKMSS